MAKKIGIIGAGGMLQYHAAGFKAAGGQLHAICDMNQEAAKSAANTYDVPNVFADSQKMLEELQDLTRLASLRPIVRTDPLLSKRCRQASTLFCEKPPALNASEVKQMKEAAENAGKTLMFNFNNRARPESYALREYIDAGEVGAINSAQAKWIRRTGIPGFGGWFTNKELSGGGPLIDLLHMVDLALYYMDYPQPSCVLAQTFDDFIQDKKFKGPWGIPDVADGVTGRGERSSRFRSFSNRSGAEFPNFLGGNEQARGGLRDLSGEKGGRHDPSFVRCGRA